MIIDRRIAASPRSWRACVVISALLHVAALVIFPARRPLRPRLAPSIQVELIAAPAPARPAIEPAAKQRVAAEPAPGAETGAAPRALEHRPVVSAPARLAPQPRQERNAASAAGTAPEAASQVAERGAVPAPAQDALGRAVASREKGVPPLSIEAGAAAPPHELPRTLPPRQVADRGGARKSYLDACRALIERRKEYPPFARKGGIEGTVVIAASLSRDGILIGSKVQQGSGSQLLDSAALRSVRSVTRFPPLPPVMGDEPFQFQVPVTFRISSDWK